MTANSYKFQTFFRDFKQDILKDSETDGTTHEDKFTELMMDALEEADETENAVVCYHRKTGIKVNGYGINDSGDILDFFVSDYSGYGDPVNISRTEIENSFKRAEKFFEKCIEGYYQVLEEAQPVYDLSERIFRFNDEFRKIRFFLLTDRISRIEEIKDREIGDFYYTYQVWDISRYFKLVSSGKARESIMIKLKEEFNSSLPCLYEGEDNPVYSSYLAAIPGNTLVNLYDEYGPRLLERNVRSFLQVRGNVNKGIKNTVLNEPEMFLAYNNGLSTTAEDVKVETIDGKTYITEIIDFQIVNGAQTTATIHDTYLKNNGKIDLDFVKIPMKLTVLRDHSKLNELVPQISQFSNTQNKIDMADFSSNHPFHIKMEELSGRIRAPSKEGIQLESYWFYERVRGQYLNKRNREFTLSKKKLFDKIYPKKQKIEKTELPIFEHTWQMRPYDVSLGKQKNYKIFMSEISQDGSFEPDERYFTEIIAKAILYKETYSIVRKELEGGYRPNIVTYSLGYLNYKTGNKINLEKIWKEQKISNELRNTISILVKEIQKYIVSASEGRNVTEYCKKKECWERLCNLEIRLPEEVTAAFKSYESANNSQSERKNISFSSVSPEDWENLVTWGMETDLLDSKERSTIKKCFSNLKGGRYCSPDLMLDAISILNRAVSNGFCLSSPELFVEEDVENAPLSERYNLNNSIEYSVKPVIGKSGISDEMIEMEIVQILKENKGKCKISEIIETLENKWNNEFTEYDLKMNDSGYPRWRIRVTGMKNHLIDVKILKKYSKNGIWVLNSDSNSKNELVETELIKDKYGKFLNTGISDERIEKDIITVLKNYGGSTQLNILLSELENIWIGLFNEIDLEKSKSGSIRWRVRVASKKNVLIQKGILDKNRQSGIWKLHDSLISDKNAENEIQENIGNKQDNLTDFQKMVNQFLKNS